MQLLIKLKSLLTIKNFFGALAIYASIYSAFLTGIPFFSIPTNAFISIITFLFTQPLLLGLIVCGLGICFQIYREVRNTWKRFTSLESQVEKHKEEINQLKQSDENEHKKNRAERHDGK